MNALGKKIIYVLLMFRMFLKWIQLVIIISLFKTAVLLLADIFENFVNECLEYYGLDPRYYFSSPGFSWDAMLKMTGIELELI